MGGWVAAVHRRCRRFCVWMSVVSVQGYGPPGLPEREYEDVYGPYGPNANSMQPPQFLRRRSESFATGHRGHGTVTSLAAAGRIATPPHDMTAAQPHPSGHNLSFTGTWRASGREHQTSGMHSARESVHRLLTGTMPEAVARPSVRIHTTALPTAHSPSYLTRSLSHWRRRCFQFVVLCCRWWMATRPYTRTQLHHRRFCARQTCGRTTTESISMPRRTRVTEQEITTVVASRLSTTMYRRHRLVMRIPTTGRLRRTALAVRNGYLGRGGSESRRERLQRCGTAQH